MSKGATLLGLWERLLGSVQIACCAALSILTARACTSFAEGQATSAVVCWRCVVLGPCGLLLASVARQGADGTPEQVATAAGHPPHANHMLVLGCLRPLPPARETAGLAHTHTHTLTLTAKLRTHTDLEDAGASPES